MGHTKTGASGTVKLTKEQENLVRVCTRDYMDKTKEWPRTWLIREQAIIHGYKAINRLIDRYEEDEARQMDLAIRQIIFDEWAKYE